MATGFSCIRALEVNLKEYFPVSGFPFRATAHSTELSGGNHVGEGGLWRLGDALRSRRVDLDGGGRARGAVAGRRQPPSASRRRFAKAGGVIGCCSQAAADKDMNNIPAQAVVARAAAGGAPSQPTLGTAARACSLSHPTRLHSRPPAPTPSSALRLIAAFVAQCRVADPPDAGQSMIVMPLSGPGGRSTAREAASLPFATLATTAELHAVQSTVLG